jgi:mannose-6-phosphate isomerase-like protein (cupin superfamily)
MSSTSSRLDVAPPARATFRTNAASRHYPRTIDNGNGELLTFLGVRDGADGRHVIEVENRVQPGSGPPMHVHYLQEESLTVQEGRMGYRIAGGRDCFAGPGDTVTFAPGQMHRFWNAGKGVLRCSGSASPPNNLEYFLTEAFASMRRGGGRPNPFDAAYLFGRYRTEFGQGDVPAPVRAIVFPLLRLVGRLLGRDRRYADAPPPIGR